MTQKSTLLGLIFQIQVVVNIAIVIDELDVLLQFGIGRLQSIDSILTKIFKLIAESFRLIVNKLGERSSVFIVILKSNLSRLT